VDALYNHIGKPEIVDLDAELRKHMKYKAISIPVFLQEYRYAFLHLERRTSFLLGKDGQAGGEVKKTSLFLEMIRKGWVEIRKTMTMIS